MNGTYLTRRLIIPAARCAEPAPLCRVLDIEMKQLLALADNPRQELTFTCTPPGAGLRMGIDRNLDNTLDGD